MYRLFVAIELSDRVKQALVSLRTAVPGAKWVPADQLHLTLAFLGEVDETAADQLSRSLAGVIVPAFSLEFTTVGCFPNCNRPRVLWVGIKQNPHLNGLADHIRSVVLECGIPQEERPFTPHITLARLKQPATHHEVARILDQPHNHELPKVAVREFILFQSQLTSGGALHSILKTFPLTDGRV